MNEGVFAAIAALIATSLLVRVLPALCEFNFSNVKVEWVERIIPTAVFITFVIYVFMQEMKASTVAAAISLGVTAAIAYLKLGGLILSLLAGCFIYYMLTSI